MVQRDGAAETKDHRSFWGFNACKGVTRLAYSRKPEFRGHEGDVIQRHVSCPGKMNPTER